MNRWKVGNIFIVPVVEIEAGEIIQQGIPEATKEDVSKIEWLQPHFADQRGNLKGVVQSFVIDTGSKRILVDTCVGNNKTRKELSQWTNLQTDFLSRLATIGYPRESINIVLCTHLHCDHVGWNTMFVDGKWVPTFPKAHYLLAKDEYNYWNGRPAAEIEDDHQGFEDSVRPIIEADLVDLVDANHVVSDGVSLIPTFGHTPSHVSVLIRSNEQEAVITGDVVHHPCQMQHPEWKVLWDTDKEKAAETRIAFLETYADTKTFIIGSHFASPTAGYIKKVDGAYRFTI